MKYGILRISGAHSELVELRDYRGDPRVKPVDWTFAHQWVRVGRIHNTGLWHDGERMRYAVGEPDC